MRDSEPPAEDTRSQTRALEITLRIGFVLLLIAWCFWIIWPFISMIIWGIVIAVAVYPMHRRLLLVLRGRRKLAAVISTLALLALFILPAAVLTDSLVSGAQFLYEQVSSGTFSIPPPPQGLEDWPLIGTPIADTWQQATTNLSAVIEELSPQLAAVGSVILTTIAGTGLGILQFLLATIIAGVVLANAEAGTAAAHRFSVRMAGRRGLEFARVAKETIRSVARGILGVALIQALFAGIGFLVVGLPGAGLVAMICLVLGIIQIGIAPVTIPAVIYVFSTADTVTAVVFLLWCIIATLLDNILKPIFLGRGAPVPMIVIFLGALGGFFTQGILGLFLGAVILSLGFNLYQAWAEEPT